jgi:hypothetical protein
LPPFAGLLLPLPPFLPFLLPMLQSSSLSSSYKHKHQAQYKDVIDTQVAQV